MPKRWRPPTRKSISHVGTVKPVGPYQRMNCSGSVHARHTSSSGASKTRSTAGPCASVPTGTLSLAVIASLLLLHLLQVYIEPIEALVPEPPVLLHPVVDLFERARLEPARAPLRVAAA